MRLRAPQETRLLQRHGRRRGRGRGSSSGSSQPRHPSSSASSSVASSPPRPRTLSRLPSRRRDARAPPHSSSSAAATSPPTQLQPRCCVALPPPAAPTRKMRHRRALSLAAPSSLPRRAERTPRCAAILRCARAGGLLRRRPASPPPPMSPPPSACPADAPPAAGFDLLTGRQAGAISERKERCGRCLGETGAFGSGVREKASLLVGFGKWSRLCMVRGQFAPPTPMPPSPSGDVANAVADLTAAPPPPSPSPVAPSPREDVPLPISPPGGRPARARRSKRARAATADEGTGTAASPRRKRRGTREPRAAGVAASTPASPVKRNVRPGRVENGKEVVEEEAAEKVRRRKISRKTQTAKGSLVLVKEEGSSLALVSYPPTNLTRGANNEGHNGWEGLWETVVYLVMWNDVAKSAFWFGSGSMVFISSSLSTDMNFSPISMCCQFGIVMLGLAFFKDSVFQRQQREPVRQFQLTDEDVRHAIQAVLPVVNTVISMAQSVFSGDPSMTLKVLPILLFGAKFGHLLTVRSLLATGFFSCFTLPKLYRCYSGQLHTVAKGLKDQILNAWKSCPRKKLVMAAAVITCWNLISVKTRILAAFSCVVTLRYYYQYRRRNNDLQREIDTSHGEDQTMMTED